MALRQGEGKLDAFMHQKVAWHFPGTGFSQSVCLFRTLMGEIASSLMGIILNIAFITWTSICDHLQLQLF